MANREISQFATLAAGSQSPTMILPIVDTSLGHVAAANKQVTLNALFFDLGLNTSDGATGMTGLNAAPSASVAGKLKWYYNNSTKQWLASIDTGSYYSVQRSIAAGLTAGWLPYVDTGGILNGSANATLDSNGQIGCKFLNLTSNSPGLNSVAEINDSTATDRWEIRLGASNQLIFNDVVNNKDVLTMTPGATPVVQLNGTLRWLTDNTQDIGLINSGRARTAYIGTSVIVGRSSNTTGVLTFNNSTNTNQTSFQAGAAAASRTYTWPTDFGAAGSVLTDAAGNGTLSWAVPAGTIGGSIAANQIAFGSGANTIAGSANFTWDDTLKKLTITSAATGTPAIAINGGTNRMIYQAISGAGTNLSFGNNATNDQIFFIQTSSGRVGVGTASAWTSTAPQSTIEIRVNNSTEVGQIIQLAAAATGSAAQVKNSSGTVLTDINSGGMLTIGTASAILDRAIYIKSPGFDSSAATYGVLSAFTVPTTSTTSSTGFYSQFFVGSAAYTVANAYCFYSAAPSISGSGAITNNYGHFVANQGTAAITNAVGICILSPTSATNNIQLLLGTSTAPSGSFAIYQSGGTNFNFFAGNSAFGGGAVDANSIVFIGRNVTDPAAAQYVIQGTRTLVLTGNNSQDGYQQLINTSTQNTAFNLTGSHYGTVSSFIWSNTGTTTLMANFRATVNQAQAGTITTWKGFAAEFSQNNASATVTNFYNFYSDVNAQNGTLGTRVGFYQPACTANSTTNNVGIVIGAVSGATNNVHLLLGTTSIPSGTYGAYILSTGAGTLPLYIRANAGQSVPLTSWADSTPTVQLSVLSDASGITFNGAAVLRTVGGNQLNINNGGNTTTFFVIQPTATNGYFKARGDIFISFAGSTSNANTAADIGIYRNGAGVLEVNDGLTANNYRDLRARYIGIGLAPTSGVLNIGGASQSGAYVSVSTSSQVANDKLISVSMAGSITGLLYAADISMTATTGVLTRITNTENATATSNCELRLVVGGSSAGDPFIHFNITGNTDWSIGARNTDSDNLTITAASDLSTSVILKVTTAGAFTVIDGSTWNVGTTTGLKLGTSGGASGQKLGFFNATPIVQPLLATGAGATVDNVITVLQNLGLCRQT